MPDLIRLNSLFRYKKYLLFISLFALACDAPRNNPSDPLSPNSSGGVIEGVVQTLSVPRNPIEGVTVLWLPENKFALTSANGAFSFSNVDNHDGYLIFSKEGFKTDSLFIQWNNEKSINRTIELNSIPVLNDLRISSVVINQASGKTTNLEIDALITDNENDIVSVNVWNSNFGFNKKLGYNAVNRTFETTLSSGEMNLNNIEETIGISFNLSAQDTFGTQHQLGTGMVTRIISNGTSIISPSGNAIVSSTPLLQWENFSASFVFTYSVEIYTDDVTPLLVYNKEDIPSTTNSVIIETPLAPGQYSWVIWVKDNLLNKVRSVPALFIVQ